MPQKSKFEEKLSYNTTKTYTFLFHRWTVCLKQKGELPPGRSSTRTGTPFRDADIETELEQLRQRSKEF